MDYSIFFFQMKPTSPLKRMNDKESSMVIVQPLVEIALKGESCPIGTVPIKKTIKEVLIREKMLNAGNPGLHVIIYLLSLTFSLLFFSAN